METNAPIEAPTTLEKYWIIFSSQNAVSIPTVKLRREGIAEHTLDFEASLAEGEMNVYIGVDGEKELLLTVKGGESYDETITLDDKYDNEKTIYIILETIGKCVDGDFEFEYN